MNLFFFISISMGIFSSNSFASRPAPSYCKAKVEIQKIERISEVSGNGATLSLMIKILESECKNVTGNRSVTFVWDPVARFKYRLEKLNQSNKEISELGIFEEGRKLEVVLDSYNYELSEINGLKLPKP